MAWSPLFPCIYHTNGWQANEKWRWGPLSLWFSEDVSCHSSPSGAHLAVRMNPISLFSFTSLWNWQALLFFSSLSPQEPHSFSTISPQPFHTSLCSLSVNSASLSTVISFWALSLDWYHSFSLYVTHVTNFPLWNTKGEFLENNPG